MSDLEQTHWDDGHDSLLDECPWCEIERLREMLEEDRIRFIKGGDFLAKETLVKRIEELEANHIPLDAKLSVSCVLEAGQLPRDLLLAVNGEPTDQAIDCCWLLGPYEREIKRLRERQG